MDGNDLWGEGEEEGSRHTLLSLSHLPLSLSLNIQMKELVKKSRFGSNLKPVGGFGSSLKPLGRFPLLSGWFGELTLLLHDLPGLPLCKKLDFSQRSQ